MFKKDLLTADTNTSTKNSLHAKRITEVGVQDFTGKKNRQKQI